MHKQDNGALSFKLGSFICHDAPSAV